MSSKDKEKDEYNWSVYPEEIPEIKYEVKTLPLQNEISQIRKSLCHTYSKYEGNWTIIKRNSLKKYNYLKDQLSIYGIKGDSLIVQGTAVGGATLLGYLLGRKKGIIRRSAYSLMGGALVGGAFYFSDTENRNWFKNEVKDRYSFVKTKWSSLYKK